MEGLNSSLAQSSGDLWPKMFEPLSPGKKGLIFCWRKLVQSRQAIGVVGKATEQFRLVTPERFLLHLIIKRAQVFAKLKVPPPQQSPPQLNKVQLRLDMSLVFFVVVFLAGPFWKIYLIDIVKKACQSKNRKHVAIVGKVFSFINICSQGVLLFSNMPRW